MEYVPGGTTTAATTITVTGSAVYEKERVPAGTPTSTAPVPIIVEGDPVRE